MSTSSDYTVDPTDFQSTDELALARSLRCRRCGMAIWRSASGWFAISAGRIRLACGWHRSHRP